MNKARPFFCDYNALNLKRTIKEIFKGLAVFIASGLIGIITLFLFSLKNNLENAAKSVGLGIIALAPALIIIYSIVYFMAGGFLGLSAYIIYRYWKHKNDA